MVRLHPDPQNIFCRGSQGGHGGGLKNLRSQFDSEPRHFRLSERDIILTKTPNLHGLILFRDLSRL